MSSDVVHEVEPASFVLQLSDTVTGALADLNGDIISQLEEEEEEMKTKTRTTRTIIKQR